MGLGVKMYMGLDPTFFLAIQSAPTYRVPVSGYGEKHDAVAMSADTVTILVIICTPHSKHGSLERERKGFFPFFPN